MSLERKLTEVSFITRFFFFFLISDSLCHYLNNVKKKTPCIIYFIFKIFMIMALDLNGFYLICCLWSYNDSEYEHFVKISMLDCARTEDNWSCKLSTVVVLGVGFLCEERLKGLCARCLMTFMCAVPLLILPVEIRKLEVSIIIQCHCLNFYSSYIKF